MRKELTRGRVGCAEDEFESEARSKNARRSNRAQYSATVPLFLGCDSRKSTILGCLHKVRCGRATEQLTGACGGAGGQGDRKAAA